MNVRDEEELSVRAGEYVLGTMRGEERKRFELEMAADFGVRREVYAWQDRLFNLNLVPQPGEAPGGTLWNKIERSLPAAASRLARVPFWSRLAVWRWTGAGGLAVAALLAVALVLRPEVTRLETHYVAVLQNPERTTAGWVVDASDPREIRMIPLVDNTVAGANAMEIWTKTDSAASPTSLGLLPTNAVTVIPLSRLPALEGNQLFEITLEPPTGSPTGRPTGPILYLGRTVSMPAKKTL